MATYLQEIRRSLTRLVNTGLLGRRCVFSPSLRGCDVDLGPDLAAYSWDYVRYASWILALREIQRTEVPGDLAELGVYKGESAALLNRMLPERRLYLFDTFEGFAETDLSRDENLNLVGKGGQAFLDTSLESVMARMPVREMCTPRPGYFPETAAGLEDHTFAFVSVDADLFNPIYEGLRFFYPRLASGGYLFVHDYQHKIWKGATDAIRRFSAESGVPFVPVPDGSGSVVFVKPQQQQHAA